MNLTGFLIILSGAVCLSSRLAAFDTPSELDVSKSELIVRAANELEPEAKDKLDRLAAEIVKAAQVEQLHASMPPASLIKGSLAALKLSGDLESARDDADVYYRRFYSEIITPCRSLDEKLTAGAVDLTGAPGSTGEPGQPGQSGQLDRVDSSGYEDEAQNWIVKWNVCGDIVNGNIEDESYELFLYKKVDSS